MPENHLTRYSEVERMWFAPKSDVDAYECTICWALVGRASRYLHYQYHETTNTLPKES